MTTNLTGITMHSSPPFNPLIGDVYCDNISGYLYMFDGSKWVIFSSNGTSKPERETIPIPTLEQLEKYPALRQAWDELIIVKKLLGI